METIAAILERVKSNLSTESSIEEPDIEEPCPTCLGRGYISTPGLPVGHPQFGKAIACEQCRPQVESFFESLDVTDANRDAISEGVAMALKPAGWLILKGTRGVGKTAIATAILSGVNRRHTNPYQAAALLDFWRSRIDVGDFSETFGGMCQLPFFVIDDLAAVRPVEPGRGDSSTTPWALERLTVLLDHRYARRLPTVITTDRNEIEMAHIVGPRIADRVFDQHSGLCTVIPITGPSRRTGREW